MRGLPKGYSLYQEGVIYVGENGILGDNVINLLQSDNFGFLEHFYGNVLAGLFVFGKPDTTKRT